MTITYFNEFQLNVPHPWPHPLVCIHCVPHPWPHPVVCIHCTCFGRRGNDAGSSFG